MNDEYLQRSERLSGRPIGRRGAQKSDQLASIRVERAFVNDVGSDLGGAGERHVHRRRPLLRRREQGHVACWCTSGIGEPHRDLRDLLLG
jgi:hypothetical protein